jgi:hypothetical protein
MSNPIYCMFSPLNLARAFDRQQGLREVKERVLASIDATTDMADIYRAIETELALARIDLGFKVKADFCVDVFQARQDAYPDRQIANDAGYYA